MKKKQWIKNSVDEDMALEILAKVGITAEETMPDPLFFLLYSRKKIQYQSNHGPQPETILYCRKNIHASLLSPLQPP